MYHATQYIIREGDKLFEYCQKMSALANNMYNVALFHIRQVMTAMSKKANGETLHANEVAVLADIETYLPAMNARRKKGDPFEMPTPTKKFVGYHFLDALFKVSDNVDYMSDLPKQATQNMIKLAARDMKAFFAALRAYKEDPSPFTGKPNLPRYKKSGGQCTIEFTNQDARLCDGELKLPKTKTRLAVGPHVKGTLKTVEIKPYCGCFKIIVVCDDGIATPEAPKESVRIAAIDFGVNNIAAIANNVGLPGLLFKGGVIKAENQWYNKKRASITHGLTVGHKNPTQRTCRSLEALSAHRDDFMRTFLHTVSNRIIQWCVENNIDTLILGHNKGWKQDVNIGAVNNQSFVNIPFSKLQEYLRYKGENNGIKVIDQEESYTSKAGFLDMDMIPIYSETSKDKPSFSGRRIQRGLYRSKDGTVVNADLNSAGNILRKAFPDAFTTETTHRFLTDIITM